MRSMTLPGRGNSDMGLKLDTSEGSPGFCKGTTVLSFPGATNI